jgi:surface protein
MLAMFEDSQFNGDISNWDVSKVNNMVRLFSRSQFNGDISKWNVAKKTDKTNMFKNSLLEKEGKLPKWYKD